MFKSSTSKLINEVVPDTFRFLADEVQETINVHGSGISYKFINNGLVNVIHVVVQSDRRPEHDATPGGLTILIEVENKYLRTDVNLEPYHVQAFCNEYADVLMNLKNGGGGPA